MQFFEEIRDLTKRLVAIPSVNSAGAGEKEIACFIERYLRSIPYFRKRPSQVIVQPLTDDKLGRRNVFALLCGEKKPSKNTIILHGHIDTVGVEDYGSLQDAAFDCDELARRLQKTEMPEDAGHDLRSGDYLFGRGALDMKSGDAVFLVLAHRLAEHPESFSGNLLFSFNPVEENLHTGILEGLRVLETLREEQGLHYLFAINNDYICPLYEGDGNRYVYTGAVGKLLPCFYILGRETHVGQPFEGFDAAMVAAELVRRISLNSEFCDEYRGEFTLPPAVLKIQDLKPSYNVQTPLDAFVYFNYMIHDASLDSIIQKLKQAARDSLEAVRQNIGRCAASYSELTGVNCSVKQQDLQVLDYSTLFQMAADRYGGSLETAVEEEASRQLEKGTDKREISMVLIRRLCKIAAINRPTAVLFFAPPYCPHVTLHPDDPEQGALYREIQDIVQSFAEQSNEQYKLLQFFPSLSDSSYLSMDDDEESVKKLTDNFPAYSILYPLPFDRIRRLSIPALNYGCYGKDAHKWTERVYMPYSFETLPRLLLKTFQHFLDLDPHIS
jgi:arginine utilization protein RocB